jgi:hypothetical protein
MKIFTQKNSELIFYSDRMIWVTIFLIFKSAHDLVSMTVNKSLEGWTIERGYPDGAPYITYPVRAKVSNCTYIILNMFNLFIYCRVQERRVV